MAFNPSDYRQRLTLADGDVRLALRTLDARINITTGSDLTLHPEPLTRALRSFLNAGAKLLVTPTDEANALAHDPLPQYAARSESNPIITDINRAAASFYRAVVDKHAPDAIAVIGAIGPTQRLLMLDEIAREQLQSACAEQAKALAEGGVDAICCRSFVELDALIAAVEAARAATGLPVIGGMRFDAGADGSETTLGVTAPQAAAALESAGAIMAAIDSGERPDTAESVAALMRRATNLPIWLQTSAGFPQLNQGRLEYPESPSDFAERAAAIVRVGANIIGGGPGVTPDHIAALAASITSPRKR